MVLNALKIWLQNRKENSSRRSSFQIDNLPGQLTPVETSKKIAQELSNLSASVSPTSGIHNDPFKESSDVDHSIDEQRVKQNPATLTAFNIQIIKPEVSSNQVSTKFDPPPKTRTSIVDLKQFLSAEKAAIGIRNLTNLVEVARSSREIGTLASPSYSGSRSLYDELST